MGREKTGEEGRLRSFLLFIIPGERMGGLFLSHKYPPLIPVPIRDKGVAWSQRRMMPALAILTTPYAKVAVSGFDQVWGGDGAEVG